MDASEGSAATSQLSGCSSGFTPQFPMKSLFMSKALILKIPSGPNAAQRLLLEKVPLILSGNICIFKIKHQLQASCTHTPLPAGHLHFQEVFYPFCATQTRPFIKSFMKLVLCSSLDCLALLGKSRAVNSPVVCFSTEASHTCKADLFQ